MIILRDSKTVTYDSRIDRIEEFDPLSLNYGIIAATERVRKIDLSKRELISKRWIRNKGKHLNQGREGACVGMGKTNLMRFEPFIGDNLIYNEDFAIKKLYWEAQRNDSFPGGEYPGANPIMQGTSLLSVLKEGKKLGIITEYAWAFSLEQLLIGVGYFGPCMIGVKWFEGMANPNVKDRMLRPTGNLIGGHCVIITGINLAKRVLYGVNSWGDIWNGNGEFVVTFEVMERLLQDRGECAFIVKNIKK